MMGRIMDVNIRPGFTANDRSSVRVSVAYAPGPVACYSYFLTWIVFFVAVGAEDLCAVNAPG
jgi:hypothetical protein